MLNSQNHGTVLTMLIEKHRPALAFNNINLDFYYGAGAHVGFARLGNYNEDDYSGHNNRKSRVGTFPQLGVDGYASFEYMLPRYPVSVNLDCKPYFELFDDSLIRFHLPVLAVGAKYVF
jgi:hypothetical protein